MNHLRLIHAWSLVAAFAGATPAAEADSPNPGEVGNEFAIDLYARLHPTPGNLLVSPISIATGLEMVHAGAREETASRDRQGSERA